MKKRSFARFAALLCGVCLVLSGCGGGESSKKAPFDPEKTARALLDAPGVFTEELERLDDAILEGFYGLEGAGVTEAVCWYSPGGTAEEVTVLRFADAEAAEAFLPAARAHIEDQKEANESYRPQEIPKLEKALIERRGETLLVLVADDHAAAKAALD